MENKGVEHVGTYEDVQHQLVTDAHQFIILPNAKNIGIIDANKSMENLSIIVERAKSALKQGFYIEFISLKIQYLEFYLKIYWVSKNPKNKVLDESVQKFFGSLINECESFGFDIDLIDKIKDFNSSRVKAIHKFLMGGTTENELKIVSDKYSKLGNELYEYVISECGEFVDDVTKLPQDVGTIIISRPR